MCRDWQTRLELILVCQSMQTRLNDPRRLNSALSGQWTVASPTWVNLPSTWLNRRWRWRQWLALCVHGPHKFSEWLTGKRAPSSFHFEEIRPTCLTDRKCTELTKFVCINCAEWFKLLHTYKTYAIYVKESPEWDIKPFCTPCTQIETKSSQEVEVCCRQ